MLKFKVFTSGDAMDRFVLEGYILGNARRYKVSPKGNGFIVWGDKSMVTELKDSGYSVLVYDNQ